MLPKQSHPIKILSPSTPIHHQLSSPPSKQSQPSFWWRRPSLHCLIASFTSHFLTSSLPPFPLQKGRNSIDAQAWRRERKRRKERFRNARTRKKRNACKEEKGGAAQQNRGECSERPRHLHISKDMLTGLVNFVLAVITFGFNLLVFIAISSDSRLHTATYLLSCNLWLSNIISSTIAVFCSIGSSHISNGLACTQQTVSLLLSSWRSALVF